MLVAVTPHDIRRTRRRLALSQAKFAALVGVAPNTVARWERGELGMRPTTARLIRLLTDPSPRRPARQRGATKERNG
jgi:DNA-binding transcriptional regulator YiaG